MRVKTAATDSEILQCYSVMQQLRPHISRGEFVARVREQMKSGYQLIYADACKDICAVAGFRLSLNLAWGKFLYVDDLVTDETRRSKGAGQILVNWLIDHAKENGCDELHLDSGVQRHGAHKFYLRLGMIISSHHFALKLK